MNFKCFIILGEVIKHGDTRVVFNEGMPRHRNPDERGDLIINYKVKFPEKISKKNVELLLNLLPGKSEPLIPDNAVYAPLVSINPDSVFRSNSSNDDDPSGGQSVRCATQ